MYAKPLHPISFTYRSMHIYPWQMDPTSDQRSMLHCYIEEVSHITECTYTHDRLTPCQLTIDPCYTVTPSPCQLTIDPCNTITPHAKQLLELGQCSSLQNGHCNYVTAQVKFTARVTIKFTARVIQFCEAQPISAISLKICTPKLQLLHNTEQRSLDMERWLTTLENFYIQKTFYLGG